MSGPGDQCNYCAAPIKWLTSANGKRMPVNAQPDQERGNVVLLGQKAAVLGPSKATAARAQGVEAYLHHAADCPYAVQWRQDKSGRRR